MPQRRLRRSPSQSADSATPQPTLLGYTAWVFNRLVAAKGEGKGPVAKWIIDQWVEQHTALLADVYEIKREQWQRTQRSSSTRAAVNLKPGLEG